MGRPDDMYSYSPQFFRAIWKSEIYEEESENSSRKTARTKGSLNLSFLMPL
jgi:hypothetical protein